MTRESSPNSEYLCVSPMNAEMGGEVRCNGTSSKDTAIDQLQRHGVRMGKGVQVKANQDGGVQEAIEGSRVDQRSNMNWRLTRYEEVHHEREMARGGEGEGRGGKGKGATQPSSY